MLAEKRLEEITVNDIVGRARSSIGSFYARFSGKQALVAALMERYHDDVLGRLEQAATDYEWRQLSLESKARRFIEMVFAVCRQRRGLLRLRMQIRLSQPGNLPHERDRDLRVVAAIQQIFLPHRDDIRHADPERALAFALRLVDSVASSALLIEEISNSFGNLSEDDAVDELTRAFTAYLTG